MATMASDSEVAPGITSLSEALSLSIAWLDGDVTAGPSAATKSNNGGSSNGVATATATDTDGDTDASNTAATLPPQTPIEKAIALLSNLQTQISRNGLISSNESLDDISTSSLELLGVEYQLGRAFLMLPTYAPPPAMTSANDNSSSSNGNSSNNSGGPSPSLMRKRNVTRAMEYFHSFLKRLEQLGEDLLQEATLKEYHTMLDLEEDHTESSNTTTTGNGGNTRSRMNPSQIRSLKIARFQRKKAAEQTRLQLQSQLQRRSRLGLSEEESMEGHNLESLQRTLFVETLRLYAEEALEEMQSSKGELEMLEMALKMESARLQGGMDARMNRGEMGMMRPMGQAGARMGPPSSQNGSNGPMQMTQITQNPITGQLEYTKKHISNGQIHSMGAASPVGIPIPQQTIRRQDIAEGVFKPGWNQPTMSLAELGEIERREAIARSEAQKAAEAEAIYRPRRYDQLERDGMEDNQELVEASAKLDREWDDWKDENPRGSGNKMGERGDRNF